MFTRVGEPINSHRAFRHGDIGSANNSTADLSRQIRSGLNADDLDYYGGEFRLGPEGFILLNGDTGLSRRIKDDLEAIIGQPRAIPIFTTITGHGNNSMFTIVGFAGIRIVQVQLSEAMNSKKVMLQPAFVMDSTVLTTQAALQLLRVPVRTPGALGPPRAVWKTPPGLSSNLAIIGHPSAPPGQRQSAGRVPIGTRFPNLTTFFGTGALHRILKDGQAGPPSRVRSGRPAGISVWGRPITEGGGGV